MDWQSNSMRVGVSAVVSAVVLTMLSGCQSVMLTENEERAISAAIAAYKAHPDKIRDVRVAKFQLTTNDDLLQGESSERALENKYLAMLYGQSRFSFKRGIQGIASNDVEIAAWLDVARCKRFSPYGEQIEFNCRAVTAYRDSRTEPNVVADCKYTVTRDLASVKKDPEGAYESLIAEILRKHALSTNEALDRRFPLVALADWKIDDGNLGIASGEGAGFRRGDWVVIVDAKKDNTMTVVAVGEVFPNSGRGTLRVSRWMDEVISAELKTFSNASPIPSERRFLAIRITV